MRTYTLALALAFSLLACNDKAGDGDDGDDGSGDAGAVDDDADDDGLTDTEEADLGLDPNLADSDGDGFDDPTEVDAGTDGTICWSVPDGWPNCVSQAPDLEGTGWGEDEVMPDWFAIDQFDEEVEFYQFYGEVVVLDFSATWCGPCNSAAPGIEELYQEYKDQGVMFLTIMIDDASNDGVVSDDDVRSDWADDHGLTFPVLTDDSVEYDYNGTTYNFAEVYYELAVLGYVTGIPSFVVLDRTMNVTDMWDGENESGLINAIEDALEQ